MSYNWRNSETENSACYRVEFPISLSPLEREVLQELDDEPLSAKRFLTATNGREPTRLAEVCEALERRGLMDSIGAHFAPTHCEEAYALTRLGWCALEPGRALRSYALAMRDLLRTLDDGVTLVPDTDRYWQKHWLQKPAQEDAVFGSGDRREYTCSWLAEHGLATVKDTVDWKVIGAVESGHQRDVPPPDYPGERSYARSDRADRLLAWLEQRYASAPDGKEWFFCYSQGAKMPGLPRHRSAFPADHMHPWPELSSL